MIKKALFLFIFFVVVICSYFVSVRAALAKMSIEEHVYTYVVDTKTSGHVREFPIPNFIYDYEWGRKYKDVVYNHQKNTGEPLVFLVNLLEQAQMSTNKYTRIEFDLDKTENLFGDLYCLRTLEENSFELTVQENVLEYITSAGC